MENILNDRRWTPNDCQVIIGADFNTNYDIDTYRDVASIKPKARGELSAYKA